MRQNPGRFYKHSRPHVRVKEDVWSPHQRRYFSNPVAARRPYLVSKLCFLAVWGHVIGKRGVTVVQEVEKSFSNQKVASSIPCRSVLEQDTEPLIAPDVQCAISVNVK